MVYYLRANEFYAAISSLPSWSCSITCSFMIQPVPKKAIWANRWCLFVALGRVAICYFFDPQHLRRKRFFDLFSRISYIVRAQTFASLSRPFVKSFTLQEHIAQLAPCYPIGLPSQLERIYTRHFQIMFIGVESRSSAACTGSSGAIFCIPVIPVENPIGYLFKIS